MEIGGIHSANSQAAVDIQITWSDNGGSVSESESGGVRVRVVVVDPAGGTSVEVIAVATTTNPRCHVASSTDRLAYPVDARDAIGLGS